MIEVDDRLELSVESVAHGGVCVARHDGATVFVRHAMPGERVVAVVTEVRATFLRADAVEVLVAAADRVTPPCPWARPGLCGGCDWQHVAPHAQRRLKAEVVAGQLKSLAGLDVEVVVEVVPGDADGLGWRTRVQYAVSDDGVAGLRKHRSHDVVAVDWCRIAAPGVVDLDVPGRRWPDAGSVEAIAGGTGDRALVVTPRRARARVEPRADIEASMLVADGKGGVASLRGRPGVREQVGGRTFWVGGSTFWQVHPGAAAVLVEAVLDVVRPRPGDRAVDLYAGVGLFAAALAERVAPGGEVFAVEGAPGAVADARVNLRDLPAARVAEGRVDAALRRLGLGRVDIAVLDPPRTGAGRDVVELLAGLSPRAIAYVACDPAALARDLATFATLGYRLDGLRAFDLFPMTQHVECVAALVREESVSDRDR
ncbi:MAG TPA: TRAM domain-containing protein [Mycobacteriales bacterium]|nr:TRAM domain-containing protein [Mycobacteriales bacterium]